MLIRFKWFSSQRIWHECLDFDHDDHGDDGGGDSGGDGDGDSGGDGDDGDNDDHGDGENQPGLAKLAKTSNFMDKLLLLCYPQCPDFNMIMLDLVDDFGEAEC